MSEDGRSLTDLLTGIEHILVDGEPGARLNACSFRLSLTGADVSVLILPTIEQARATFATNGNQLVAPKAFTSGFYRRSVDGTITDRTHYPARAVDPPIPSSEALPHLGDENFVWRGYDTNTRGVIKLRVGRVLADFNAPSLDDADRLARRFVARVAHR